MVAGRSRVGRKSCRRAPRWRCCFAAHVRGTRPRLEGARYGIAALGVVVGASTMWWPRLRRGSRPPAGTAGLVARPAPAQGEAAGRPHGKGVTMRRHVVLCVHLVIGLWRTGSASSPRQGENANGRHGEGPAQRAGGAPRDRRNPCERECRGDPSFRGRHQRLPVLRRRQDHDRPRVGRFHDRPDCTGIRSCGTIDPPVGLPGGTTTRYSGAHVRGALAVKTGGQSVLQDPPSPWHRAGQVQHIHERLPTSESAPFREAFERSMFPARAADSSPMSLVLRRSRTR